MVILACVTLLGHGNKDPQVLRGTGYNRDGELMFHTAINCNTFGSCPPYRVLDELACVVCTR